jgi:acyl carrier protein
MEAIKVLGPIAALAAAGAGVFAYEWINRRRARRRLSTRPQLSTAEFAQSHFGASEERRLLAKELYVILSHHLPYPLAGLSPDDTFIDDLRMDALDSLAAVEFVVEVEKRFGITIADADAQGMRTLRDVVDYLQPRVATKAASG